MSQAPYQHAQRLLDLAAARGRVLEVRYAVLACALASMPEPGAALENALRRMSARLRAPADCAELALLALREREQIAQGAQLEAEAMVALLQACDAWRRPTRFGQLLQAVESAEGGAAEAAMAAPRLLAALSAARAVDAAAIARAESEPQKIAARLRLARVAAVSAALAAR